MHGVDAAFAFFLSDDTKTREAGNAFTMKRKDNVPPVPLADF